jgi:hypothetical protein
MSVLEHDKNEIKHKIKTVKTRPSSHTSDMPLINEKTVWFS